MTFHGRHAIDADSQGRKYPRQLISIVVVSKLATVSHGEWVYIISLSWIRRTCRRL